MNEQRGVARRLGNGVPAAHGPATSAAKARALGTWFVAEQYLRGMRGYLDVIIAYSIGNPLMYLFAMGVGLATLVDANSPGAFGSVGYLVFIVPALLASAAVMTAAEEFSYPVSSGFKWRRTYYGPLASPISSAQICQGHALAVTLRIFVQSAVYLGIVAAFGAVPSGWAVLSVFTATLTGMAFGLPLMAYAASITEDRGQFAMVQRFVVMPLFLFSGTFFPLQTLPVFLRWIGWISPIWHGTSLGRVLSYSMSEPLWLSAVHVLFLVLTAGAGLIMARRIYSRRLEG
ncbi:ABC transporter permease [Paeniglutamicibacter cryotolerans]|uniref:Transport permease protein n=1 Tax=Paeniglutamicibacter cryotolerans TaxID=670079 RepID=A0A839QJ86_9MICC|nr:ABC transporter permease [Paeniglutamicibacter cryotolerans]MBB2995867.1 lipooligosaccharide transport system permease protein [Paeniglutamicibacter cryotolerans]